MRQYRNHRANHQTWLRRICLALSLATGLSTTASAGDKPEIKSGVSGTYCRPFDAPECKNYNNREAERVWEQRQYERKIEDAERRARERDFEYRMERERNARERFR